MSLILRCWRRPLPLRRMGLGTESAMLNPLKKAQGETNERLDRVVATQQETNRLLSQILTALTLRR